MIFLISYDLKTPGRDYTRLYDVIKTAEGWAHHLESTWLIYSREPVSVWSERIRAAIDTNDSFLIMDVTNKEFNGWLPAKAWEWIRQHNAMP